LGTGNVVQASSSYLTVDNWNLHNMYGLQSYDEKYNFNLFFNYPPPYYSSQKGVIGHLLGGWSFSPLFVYGSGFPVELNTATGDVGTFGEGNPSYPIGTNENMVGNFHYNASAHFNTAGTNGCGTAGPKVNVLSNPTAGCPINGGIFGDPLRNPILGLDGQIGGFPVRGLPFFNLDLGVSKRIRFTERISSSLHFDFTNVLNHMQPADPFFSAGDLAHWGVLGGGGAVQANDPRRLQLGITVDF